MSDANAQHTKGPWRAKLLDYRDDEIEYRILAGEAVEVASLTNHHASTEETEANARLIAAAPDLLESLKGIARICEAVRYTAGLGKKQWERVEHARAAIAKAEGR